MFLASGNIRYPIRPSLITNSSFLKATINSATFSLLRSQNSLSYFCIKEQGSEGIFRDTFYKYYGENGQRQRDKCTSPTFLKRALVPHNGYLTVPAYLRMQMLKLPKERRKIKSI